LGFRGTGAASVSTRPKSYPNLHIRDTSILLCLKGYCTIGLRGQTIRVKIALNIRVDVAFFVAVSERDDL